MQRHIKAATVSTRTKVLRKVFDCSKNFWSFVETVKNAKTSSIAHLIYDDHTFTHSVEKANILAERFSKNSSFSASDQRLPFT